MPVCEIARYELRPLAVLAARHAAEPVRGVLVRHAGGFGCLQAWPALGDAAMDVQLAALREGGGTPLVERTLECCRMDAELRAAGVSAFADRHIPASHATIPTGNEGTAATAAAANGVLVWKWKAGADWPQRIPIWQRALAAHPGARLRLDFNESLSAGEADAFLLALPGPVRDALDFIEDPCPFDPGDWARLSRHGVALAVDQAVEDPNAADFLGVVKPARDDAAALIDHARQSGRKLVVTSYMDHPFGQMWAAWWAAEALAAGVHHGPAGLASHTCFEPLPDFPVKMSHGGKILVPSGTGFGYDAEMESLEWEPLP